jgi:hypothetical protein
MQGGRTQQAVDPWMQTLQRARQLSRATGMAPEDAMQYVVEMAKPPETDAAMARLQWDQSRAPAEDQQWAAEQQQAWMLAMMNLQPRMQGITAVKQFDPQYGNQTGETPYFWQVGPDGQPTMRPMMGDNMGNNPYAAADAKRRQ